MSTPFGPIGQGLAPRHPAPRRPRARWVALLGVGAGVLLSGCALGFRAPATDITTTSATLNGGVGSNRSEQGEWWFRYGTTTAYDTETPHHSINFTANTGYDVSEPISGLEPGTTYHYVNCADDQDPDAGANCSHDQTFTTIADHDSVLVTGTTDPFDNIDVDVTSGPSGENPTGHAAADTSVGHLQSSSITCLLVSGNTANIAGSLEPNSAGYTGFRATVVDGGPNDVGPNPADTFNATGSGTVPTDCSTSVGGGGLNQGEAVVVDAPPPPSP